MSIHTHIPVGPTDKRKGREREQLSTFDWKASRGAADHGIGVTVLVFFLMSFSKTDPAYTALGDGASPEAVAEYHEKYGLDDPWPVRYVRYMGDLIHGDMGTYGAARNSVAKRISTALPSRCS